MCPNSIRFQSSVRLSEVRLNNFWLTENKEHSNSNSNSSIKIFGILDLRQDSRSQLHWRSGRGPISEILVNFVDQIGKYSGQNSDQFYFTKFTDMTENRLSGKWNLCEYSVKNWILFHSKFHFKPIQFYYYISLDKQYLFYKRK